MENNNNFINRLKKAGQVLFQNQKLTPEVTQVQGVDNNNNYTAGQPIDPVAQYQLAGRQYDFQNNVNKITSLRKNEKIKFDVLRNFVNNCDILSTVIETRKDQICSFDYEFIIKDSDKIKDERTKKLEQFFKKPNQINNFKTWLRPLIDDLLVTDAPCLYVTKTYGGEVFSLDIMDGTTINPLITDAGRIPLDGPAYQQNIKGLPVVNYTFDELYYRPRNIRSYKMYGYSPVEQIFNTVNLLLARTTNQMEYFTAGNTPDLIITTPEKWQPAQIMDFQKMWNSINIGSSKKEAKMVPYGTTFFNSKPEPLKNEFDEWLTKIICYAFSISTQAFINQVNRATAETAQETAIEEGLKPLMGWVEDLINEIVFKEFGYTDIEFRFKIDKEPDPMLAAQIHSIYAANGILTIDEIRADLGRNPLGAEYQNNQSNQNNFDMASILNTDAAKLYKQKKKIR